MSFDIKRVSMIGLGYIGLPTAALMASRGLEVIGVDVNKNTVDTINAGNVHIIEPDLDIVVRSTVMTGQLRATTEAEPADAFLIAVPTPFKNAHEPDLAFVESATRTIAPVLDKGNLVILESTSPVGTTEKIEQWLKEERPDLNFPSDSVEKSDVMIAHCPERVLPGYVLQELVTNDRIIGGIGQDSIDAATSLYKKFVKGACIPTNARTAELAKLTENAFRDVNIAFANELSLICKKLKINVWELIELSNRHPRVSILQPGPGVGGHCIAVDPWFIVDSAPAESKLIKTARRVNDHMPSAVVEEIFQKAEKFKDPTISIFGLSFKADIDDLRQSPAVEIASELIESGKFNYNIVEPNIENCPNNLLRSNSVFTTAEKAISTSDIIVVLVDHKEFKSIPFQAIKDKVVLDYKGVWR